MVELVPKQAMIASKPATLHFVLCVLVPSSKEMAPFLLVWKCTVVFWAGVLKLYLPTASVPGTPVPSK